MAQGLGGEEGRHPDPGVQGGRARSKRVPQCLTQLSVNLDSVTFESSCSVSDLCEDHI